MGAQGRGPVWSNAVAIVPLFPPRSKRAEIFPERPPLDSAFDSQIEIRQ
jgi:hypothetical protein